MTRIIEKTMPASNIVKMVVEAPKIAKKRKAGQFIMLKIDEHGERIPLTIADADAEKGTVTLIAQVVGSTTAQLAKMEAGQTLLDFAGPLGNPTHIEKVGHVVCIGGGIGVAPMHPIAQAMKAAGNRVTCIVGARSRDLLVMEKEVKAACDDLKIVTDDGSYGEKGFVTHALQSLIDDSVPIDMVVAIGPPVMMQMVCRVTEPHNIKTLVSLNTIMVDGTGMCGGCRVTVGGETRFVCVDGPEFDGHKVDFEEMKQRLAMYRDHEKESMGRHADNHECQLEKQGL